MAINYVKNQSKKKTNPFSSITDRTQTEIVWAPHGQTQFSILRQYRILMVRNAKFPNYEGGP